MDQPDLQTLSPHSSGRGINDYIKLIDAAWASIRRLESNALESALSAGALIIEAVERGLSVRKLCALCDDLAPSTAYLWRRLAKHREVIERELAVRGSLSIRDARALIAGPKKPTASKTTTTKSESAESTTLEAAIVSVAVAVAVAVADWSDAQVTEALDALGIDRIFACLSSAQRAALLARVERRPEGPRRVVKAKRVVRPALRLVGSEKEERVY